MKTVENKEVKKLIQINAKAKYTLYCALDDDMYRRVFTCKSAKEIWTKLQQIHNQVKELKINMLIREYELFRMTTEESIGDMFTRFTKIVNELESLGKSYDNVELVRKILRSLPRAWEPMVTAIQEASDFNQLKLEVLLDSLMIHETNLQMHHESTLDASSERGSEDSDDEVALMIRKIKRFLKKKNAGGKKPLKKELKKVEPSKEEQVMCYKCEKPRHVIWECLRLEKMKKKDKKTGR